MLVADGRFVMRLRMFVPVAVVLMAMSMLGSAVAWSAQPQVTLTLTASVPVGEGPMTPLLDEAQGRLFVPSSGAGTVTVIDTATQAAIGSVAAASVEGEEIRAAVLDAARSRLFVLTDSNRVVAIDTRTLAVVQRTGVPDEAQDMVLDPARGVVYVLSSMPSRLTTLASPTGRTLRTTSAPRAADVMALNPKSRRLFFDGRADGVMSVLEPRTGTRVWSLRRMNGIEGFAFNDSGSRAYVPLEQGDACLGTLVVVNTLTRRVAARIPVGESPLLPVLDQAHGKAYVASFQGDITVVDTTTLRETGGLPVTVVRDVPALDSARNRLFVPVESGAGDAVAVFDTASDQLLTSLRVPRLPGTPTVDSTGTWLYVASNEGAVLSIVAVSP